MGDAVPHGHGKRTNQGCDCTTCRTAYNDYQRGYGQRRRDSMRLTATRGRQPWTQRDLDVALDTTHTAKAAALKIGRTERAVVNIRRKHRKQVQLNAD